LRTVFSSPRRSATRKHARTVSSRFLPPSRNMMVS
jgi:hypothetical protein